MRLFKVAIFMAVFYLAMAGKKKLCCPNRNLPGRLFHDLCMQDEFFKRNYYYYYFILFLFFFLVFHNFEGLFIS